MPVNLDLAVNRGVMCPTHHPPVVAWGSRGVEARWPTRMSRAGDSLDADAQEVESRVSVQVEVTAR